MLKIWGRKNSINVQKVMWTVGELGLEPERIDAGMAHGIVGEPWYAALNPNRMVPTIDDDGVVLWESNVIVRYLAAKHAPGTLMPTDPVARAKADMWMDWQQNTLMPAGLSPLFLGLIRTPPDKRDAGALHKAAEVTESALRTLDAHLAKQAYVLGDSLTVADIPVGVATYRWYALPVEHAELPNLRAWYDRLRQRPAFAEHVMLPLT
ncbi:MAG: glutathione S-transferase family protein [Hyphomicrobiaceae bacterium]|jgi:glutathione S-transferase